MRNDYTDITVILDRSGSMSSIKEDMEGAFNEFIKKQIEVPGKCLVSLVQFDNQYDVVYTAKPVKDVGKLELDPRGSTALRDAIGRTVNELGARLRNLPESERPAAVLVVVITDGYENASREFTGMSIKNMVKHQEDNYSWRFIFIGANQDAVLVGGDLGFNKDFSMTYAATGKGTKNMYDSLCNYTQCLRVATASGCSVNSVTGFTDEDRVNAMTE